MSGHRMTEEDFYDLYQEATEKDSSRDVAGYAIGAIFFIVFLVPVIYILCLAWCFRGFNLSGDGLRRLATTVLTGGLSLMR